jgi:hypothetical protein
MSRRAVSIGIEILPLFEHKERRILSSILFKWLLFAYFIKLPPYRLVENLKRRLTP